MTFQIISTKTKEAIDLAEFDDMYCHFYHTVGHPTEYAQWFHWMERAFLAFADIADYGQNTNLYRRVVKGKDSRILTMSQAVQSLLIHESQLILSSDDGVTLSLRLEVIKRISNFFLSPGIRDKYYFEFHF